MTIKRGALTHSFIIASSGMSTYMRLQNDRGERTNFFYDGRRMKTAIFGGSGAVFAAGITLHSLHHGGLAMTLESLAMAVGMVTVPTTSLGVVRRVGKPVYDTPELVFPVTAEKYEDLRKRLNKLARRKIHGLYSIPLNNCSGFALRFARENGFDVPAMKLPTPMKLLEVIKERNRAEMMDLYKPSTLTA